MTSFQKEYFQKEKTKQMKIHINKNDEFPTSVFFISFDMILIKLYSRVILLVVIGIKQQICRNYGRKKNNNKLNENLSVVNEIH